MDTKSTSKSASLHPGWIAGGIAVLVSLWLLSGVFGSDTDEIAQDDKHHEVKRTKVRVINSQAQVLTRKAIVSARTAPVRIVTLRAEISGRVDAVVAARGALVEQDDILLKLAPRDLDAQLSRARSQLKQRQLQFEAAQKMGKQGLQSSVQIATAEADLRAAQAEMQRLRDAQTYTVVRAPFAGILETRPVEVGDYVGVGDELASIVQQDAFIVTGSVSEDVITYLHAGQQASALLPDQSEKMGTLRYVASVADEGTRTFRVELEIPNAGNRLIAGTSAVLMLPLEEVSAHEVEPSSLALDEVGDFGIKSVNTQGLVEFHEAHIAQNQNGKVWLSGLPERLTIITVGQGFVSAGDAVDVVDVSTTQP